MQKNTGPGWRGYRGSGDEVDQGFAYVVVTDSDQGRILATRLRRMDIAKVTAVIGLEEARRLCQSGGADACLVAIDAPVPDGVPVAESDAPGRCCGVPALLVCSSGHAPPAGDRTPLRVLGRRVCGNPAAHALPPPWRGTSTPPLCTSEFASATVGNAARR